MITPQEALTKTCIVPLEAVNQIDLNPKLCDDQRRFELEQQLEVSDWLVSPSVIDLVYFTDKGIRFYAYSRRWCTAPLRSLYPRSPNHSSGGPKPIDRGRLVSSEFLRGAFPGLSGSL
jgi:hypothetical protein